MSIAFNAAADLGNNGGTTNSLTASYTCGSGSNRLLVVGLVGDTDNGNDDITSVTYGGVAMTLAKKSASATGGTLRYDYIYYLLNPASGANNVVINCTNNHFLLAVAADYTGVKQSGQPDATTTQTSGSAVTSLTTSITTVADNCWAVLLEQQDKTGATPTAGAGATRRTFGASFNQPALFDSGGAITPAGSYSMTTNYGIADLITHVIASFSPAGGATCPRTLLTMGVGCGIAAAKAIERNALVTRRGLARGLLLPGRDF